MIQKPTMSTYKTYFQTYLPILEEAMQQAIAVPDPRLALHYEIMAYHLGWRDVELRPARANAGKRVRPMLCLLACEAVGGSVEDALPAAVAVELLHNFSLIHDDIEDNSPTRRHRPTVWKLWGVPQAINVGDGMFTLARRALHGLEERHPARRVLNAFRVFDDACVALTEGQHLDMRFEEMLDVSVDDYLYMVRGKTAALIAASVTLGALLGGAGESAQQNYHAFGENLGLAFQIVDDILGIWGDEATTGKSVASDILSKKKTLPVLYGLNHPQVGEEMRALYRGPAFTVDDVGHVLELLARAGAREYAEELAVTYHRQALAALEATGVASPAQEALRDLANDLLRRKA